MVHDDDTLPAQVGDDIPPVWLAIIFAIIFAVTLPVWLPVAILGGLVCSIFGRKR